VAEIASGSRLQQALEAAEDRGPAGAAIFQQLAARLELVVSEGEIYGVALGREIEGHARGVLV
jgi:hypothetical protein